MTTLFSSVNSFEEVVANATNENLTTENWDSITSVCEKVESGGEKSARDCVAAIQKRLAHRSANVQLYSLTLSNALAKSCGLPVHREICSRSFTTTLSRMLNEKSTHETVKNRIMELIQEWTHEFRSNPSLSLMEETFNELRAQGFPFLPPDRPKKPTQSELDKQKEEDDLQLALAISLSQTTAKENNRSNQSTKSQQGKPKEASNAAPPVSKVRTLYDFAPTEQGELGFSRGEIITVLETVYKDWWRGELNGRTGIFPVNYIEKIVDPTPADLAREAEIEVSVFAEARNVEKLLEMLSAIDPVGDNFSENESIQNLYHKTSTIRPKLVQLIEKYSQKKDELIALNEKFNKARTTYDKLLEQSIDRYKPNASQYQSSSVYAGEQYTYQMQPPNQYNIPPHGYVAPASQDQNVYAAPQHPQQPQQQPLYQAPTQIDPSSYQYGYQQPQQQISQPTQTDPAAYQYGYQQPQQQIPQQPTYQQQPNVPYQIQSASNSQEGVQQQPYTNPQQSQYAQSSNPQGVQQQPYVNPQYVQQNQYTAEALNYQQQQVPSVAVQQANYGGYAQPPSGLVNNLQ